MTNTSMNPEQMDLREKIGWIMSNIVVCRHYSCVSKACEYEDHREHGSPIDAVMALIDKAVTEARVDEIETFATNGRGYRGHAFQCRVDGEEYPKCIQCYKDERLDQLQHEQSIIMAPERTSELELRIEIINSLVDIFALRVSLSVLLNSILHCGNLT